jgi:hypothetical protein
MHIIYLNYFLLKIQSNILIFFPRFICQVLSSVNAQNHYQILITFANLNKLNFFKFKASLAAAYKNFH